MERVEAVPLTAEDEAILRLESGTVVGHTCKVVIMARGLPDVGALRAEIASRLSSVPELTRCLLRTGAGHAWVPDERFDVTRHVVPAPGPPADAEGLRGEVARLFAERLDRLHPLWRLDVVPSPQGGGALVWRVHHALADGTTMMRFARTLLWDPQPDDPRGGHRTQDRSSQADDARRRHHLGGFFHRELARSPSTSPFDGRIGPRREIAFATTGLAELHHAAKSLGGATLNDAVLTAVAGGLRRWIEAHHGRLGVLRVKVPVSLHHQGADAGNRDSFFTVGVPLDEPDPVSRLRATRAATAERKAAEDAATMDTLLRTVGTVSPALERWCARVERSPRSFAVNVSNVPGPSGAVSVLDVPVTGLYSIAEVAEHHALRVAVISLGDRLFFGLCADPDLVAGVQDMAEGIEAECDALVAAVWPSGRTLR
jgi:diacylglycerol O-acyltransferase / wax synthase